MSTTSMQPLNPYVFPTSTSRTSSLAPLLISASNLRSADHVMVVGPHFGEHLIALSRSACASATGFHSGHRRPHLAPADVVWITEVDDVAAQVAPLLRVVTPRLLLIELLDGRALKDLVAVLGRSRRVASVHHAHGQPRRLIVAVVSQPVAVSQAA